MRASQAPCVDSVRPAWRTAERQVQMGDRVILQTSGVALARDSAGLDVTRLVLFLDGRPVKGAYAVPVHPSFEQWEVRLRRSTAAADAWEAVLGRPSLDPRAVRFGLGPEGKPEFAWRPNSTRLDLVTMNANWFYVTLVSLLFAAIAFWWLAVTTGIIRDSVPAGLPGKNRPYSLARSQMALWLFLIIPSFLGIWAVTGEWSGIITAEALTLLGIGTGTLLGARAIEDVKRTQQEEANPALTEMRARQATLKARAKYARRTNDEAALGEIVRDLESTSGTLAAAEMAADPPSPPRRNFLLDILTDAGELSLHRFQAVIWTLVLAGVFVFAVYHTLTLPQFDPMLLALMGISGGAYLGFKFVEKQT
jgi:hypothetical protein